MAAPNSTTNAITPASSGTSKSTRSAIGWIASTATESDRSPQGDYWLPFLPDAYFEVIYPNDDVQACLVEIDMGTLTLRRFARKVQAFEAALDDGVFRRHFPNRDEFEVLVLTSSRRRLQALRQVSARVVPGGRHDLYCFATFDVLEPTAFGSAEWLDLDGRTVSGVLYDLR